MTLKFLSRRQWETVEAFADVFIAGEKEPIGPADIANNVDEQLSRMQSKRTASVKLLLWVIEFVLPGFSLPLGFSRKSRERRREIIERKITNPRASRLHRNLAKIKTLFLAGYYGDERVQRSLPFERVRERERFREKPPTPIDVDKPNVKPPGQDETEIDCNICVIGSGAGGAVIAARAAAAGQDVVLLEEGPYIPACMIDHREDHMSALLYKESGLQTTADFGMSILQGKCLGGTTVINNCICFQLLDDPDLPGARAVLDRWRQKPICADICEKCLAASYKRVSTRIDVQRLDPGIVGRNGDLLTTGWQRLLDAGLGNCDFAYGAFRKNYNQCLGCGYCNFGCPYARKMSMLETFIADASKADKPARIIPDCHAVRIRESRGRAESVECELPNNRRLTVRAGKIVVACGAIGSSVLLMKSRIGKNVGSRFSFNAATPVFARFPEPPLRSYDGVQMATFVAADDFLLESLFNPPMSFALALPGWFEDHFGRMQSYDRFASAGVVIGTNHNGRVKRTRFFRDLLGPVKYKMEPKDLKVMVRGISLLAQTFFAAGADAVYPATFVDFEMRATVYAPGGRIDAARIERSLKDRIVEPDDIVLNSSHPQGGNPMSDDPTIGVVDSRFRVHGFENLFVVDASIFPTTIRINPQLTIMALADYAWYRSICR